MQVANLIEAYIRENRLGIDDRLPRETDLAYEYEVAPGTIRRALEELRERGVVHTVHGRGTYIVRVPRAPQ
jgi:DNA-binding GntR family transcriptional regulator